MFGASRVSGKARSRHEHGAVVPFGSWISISFLYSDGFVIVRRGGVEVARTSDRALTAGYCFVGVKGGAVSIRNLRVKLPMNPAATRTPRAYEVFQPRNSCEQPMVSIVTTVYDRIGCLEQCLDLWRRSSSATTNTSSSQTLCSTRS